MKKICALKKLTQAALIITIISLTGCAGMNDKFDCNVESGGRCASMGSINKMANRGEFNENFYRTKNIAKITTSGYSSSTSAGKPIRSSESVEKIWIGPYEDSSGNYHEPSYVYTVVKKGRWIGEPVKAIQGKN